MYMRLPFNQARLCRLYCPCEAALLRCLHARVDTLVKIVYPWMRCGGLICQAFAGSGGHLGLGAPAAWMAKLRVVTVEQSICMHACIGGALTRTCSHSGAS